MGNNCCVADNRENRKNEIEEGSHDIKLLKELSHNSSAIDFFFENKVEDEIPFPEKIIEETNQTPELVDDHFEEPTKVREMNKISAPCAKLLAEIFSVLPDDLKEKVDKSPFIYKCFEQGTYKGEIINGRREGLGHCIWPNGSSYYGYWENDQQSGRGMFVEPSGNYYKGEWKHGLYNGFGLLFSKIDSYKYLGHFKNGVKHGNGEETSSTGSVFTGTFVNGLKEGKGNYVWPNGDHYEGGFKDDNIEGWGKHTSSGGKIYEGEFKNNLMHGEGLFKWSDGRSYRGYYRNDLKEGRGEYVFKDGTKVIGTWKKGAQEGEGEFYDQFGKKRRGIWQNGNRTKWID